MKQLLLSLFVGTVVLITSCSQSKQFDTSSKSATTDSSTEKITEKPKDYPFPVNKYYFFTPVGWGTHYDDFLVLCDSNKCIYQGRIYPYIYDSDESTLMINNGEPVTLSNGLKETLPQLSFTSSAGIELSNEPDNLNIYENQDNKYWALAGTTGSPFIQANMEKDGTQICTKMMQNYA